MMFRRFVAVTLMMFALTAPLMAPLAAQAQAYGGRERGVGYGERAGYGGPRGGFDAPRGGYGGGERGFGPGPEDRGGYRAPVQGPYRGPRPTPQPPRGPQGAITWRVPGPVYGAPERGLARGQYMPPQARGAVVQDFGRYHLRRPPRGYYWYRAGDDFVLASVASGVIFEVIPAEGY